MRGWASIFDYAEALYNNNRHLSLGFLSPVEYERAHEQTHRLLRFHFSWGRSVPARHHRQPVSRYCALPLGTLPQ
ncbi:IS3 family transposase [Gemmata palustris]|uniref:IS3 family transposase n=1 Tax=Gemmata palustris TaxID=2822762 RepID=UPI0036F24494